MNNPLLTGKANILSSAKSAVGLFTKALNELEKVNAQAINLATENEAKIATLTADNNELNTVVKRNMKIITNINKILED